MIPMSVLFGSRRSMVVIALIAATIAAAVACGTESTEPQPTPPATPTADDQNPTGPAQPNGDGVTAGQGGQAPAPSGGTGAGGGASGGASGGEGGQPGGGASGETGGQGGSAGEASGGAGGEAEPPVEDVGAEALGYKPNILFVIVDDQSPFDLKAYDPKSKLESPVIDSLARDGMVIDGAYHMGAMLGAVCTPSRHMVMSGRTVWHVPARKDNPGPALVPPNLVNNTMGAVFDRAGYATMRTSKVGNTYAQAGQRFEVNRVQESSEGTKANGSAWHADRVLEYLDKRVADKDERPFLIYFGFSHPHDPRIGRPELLQKYGATNHNDQSNPPTPTAQAPEVPENWLPAHPFDHGHPNLRDEVDVPGVWRRRDEQTIRNELGREFACVENIDNQLARVLDKMTRADLERTYIIYTSDHGMAIGRHGLQGKQNLYEHTWRVPMIVKGPGILAGSRRQGNVYLTDVLATLTELAGIPAPDTSEGKSFMNVLDRSNTSGTVRDVLYGVYAGGTKPGIRSVRQGDWKLIKWDVNNGAVRRTQLFNLKENPHEFIQAHQAAAVTGTTGVTPGANQVNLADDPNFAAKRAEMETLLKSEMDRLDDPHTLWDQ